MLLALLVISFLSFVIIQLPPGDYLTSYITRLKAQGAIGRNTQGPLATVEAGTGRRVAGVVIRVRVRIRECRARGWAGTCPKLVGARIWSAGILPAFVRPEPVEVRLPFELPAILGQSPFDHRWVSPTCGPGESRRHELRPPGSRIPAMPCLERSALRSRGRSRLPLCPLLLPTQRSVPRCAPPVR